MKTTNRRNLLLAGAGALTAVLGGIGLGSLLRPDRRISGSGSDENLSDTSSTPSDPTLGATSNEVPTGPLMTVYKDANCGCCTLWVDHMKAAGYNVQTIDVANLGAVKDQFGVSRELGSCHTGLIGDYVIEGHVPAAAVSRLLAERPKVRGLAVPGMPIGSPGMEVEGREPQEYDVMTFGEGSSSVFMRFRGGVVI